MKVLILGTSGLLGKKLISRLQQVTGLEIVTHANKSKNVDFNFDLQDVLQVEFFLNKIHPDVVINLVALTNVDECEINPQKAFLLNALTVKNVADVLRKSGSKLIHISTDQVYDKINGKSLENEVVLKNYYSYSKYIGEMHAVSANGIVLRTNFFGKSETLYRHSFTDWLFDSLINNIPIKLVSDVHFNPLSMTTLSDIICLLISKKDLSGIYNLGSITALSKAEFALSFVKKFKNHQLNYEVCDSTKLALKAKRPLNMHTDVSLFQEVFQIKLPTLEEEIKLVQGEYREN